MWREKERHFSFSKILNRLPPPGWSQEQMEKACRHKISCLISTTRAIFVFVFENHKLALLVWKRLMLGFYPTSLPFERAWSILSKTLQQRREEEMYWCWRRPQNAETIGVDIYRRKIFIADKSVADAKYFSPQQQLLISPLSIILSLTLLETKWIVEPKTANTFWKTFALDKKSVHSTSPQYHSSCLQTRICPLEWQNQQFGQGISYLFLKAMTKSFFHLLSLGPNLFDPSFAYSKLCKFI